MMDIRLVLRSKINTSNKREGVKAKFSKLISVVPEEFRLREDIIYRREDRVHFMNNLNSKMNILWKTYNEGVIDETLYNFGLNFIKDINSYELADKLGYKASRGQAKTVEKENQLYSRLTLYFFLEEMKKQAENRNNKFFDTYDFLDLCYIAKYYKFGTVNKQSRSIYLKKLLNINNLNDFINKINDPNIVLNKKAFDCCFALIDILNNLFDYIQYDKISKDNLIKVLNEKGSIREDIEKEIEKQNKNIVEEKEEDMNNKLKLILSSENVSESQLINTLRYIESLIKVASKYDVDIKVTENK